MANYRFGQPGSRPHTRVELDASRLGNSGNASEKVLAIVGSASSGVPGQIYTLNSTAEAQEIFRSGDLVDAVELAYRPSGNVTGAGRILAMRVDSATPATFERGALKFTSIIHGAEANDIQVSLEDNQLTKSKRLRVFFSRDRITNTYDNIGNIFTVKYTGSAETATLTVEKGSDNLATRLSLTVAGEPARNYELGRGVYENINVLVNDLNNLPNVEASFYNEGDKNLTSDMLDALSSVSVRTENGAIVTAIAGDIERQLQYSDVVEVSVDRKEAVENFGLTRLSGATDGTVPVSWASHLSKLTISGAYYVVPLSDSASIHGEVSEIVTQSSEAGNEMRALVGGGINETLTRALTRRVQLNNPRVALSGVSGIRSMVNGRQLKLPAYMTAVMIAGIACGGTVGEPTTYKSLTLDSIDQNFTGTQLDQLHDNGIMAIEFVRNRSVTQFRIVSDVTTFNDKSEPIKSEMSLGELTDFLFSDLRYTLDNEFIGTKLTVQAPSLLKNRVQSFLDERTRDPLSEITEYNPEDVQVVIRNDSAIISFVVYPARGLNHILVRGVYAQSENEV